MEVLSLNSLNNTPIKLKNYSCKNLLEAEKSAEDFRKNFINLSSKLPISDLTSILENLGIIIIYIKNYDNKFKGFDGLSEMIDGIPIIVLPAETKDGARGRFTIAHELGHLVLNIKENANAELLCNRFASTLLMPKDAVISEFGNSRNNINFYELVAFKNEYKVSYTAINYRLRDLNIISEYLFRKINKFLNANQNKEDPVPLSPEKSFQFKKMVYKLEADNIISITKACELLGVTLDDYNIENNNY